MLQAQELAKKARMLEQEYCQKRKELNGEDDSRPEKRYRDQSQEEMLNDAELGEFGVMEQEAKYRDEEINNLVRSMNELALLFKDLSVLVIDQGNILDRIDYNLEQAVHHTKKANVQLHKV